MGLNRQLIRALAGAAALILGVIACHGASTGSTGYVPTGGSSLAAPQANGAGAAAVPDRVSGDLDSTCAKHLHIVLLGIVDCKFKEKGYDGTFRIFNKTRGIVTISPSS